MSREPEFVKIYSLALDLYDGNLDSDFVRRQNDMLFGTPSTLKYVETMLVGTALVDPCDLDVIDVLREIGSTDLRYARYRELWAALQDVSGQPPTDDRDERLERVAYQIWNNWKRPMCQLPESACHAIMLSSQFVSTAGIKALARQYKEVAADMILRRRILEITADFREEHSSAQACLDRLCALRDEVAVYGA